MRYVPRPPAALRRPASELAAAERGLALGGGRVFADLWDLERLAVATPDHAALRTRLEAIDRTQK